MPRFFELLSETTGGASRRVKVPFDNLATEIAQVDGFAAQVSGLLRATATVATNVGTKQALLSAVPVGKVRIVTMVVARNATASLGSMNDDATLGFDAGADDVFSILATWWASLISSSYSSVQSGLNGEKMGAAGDVFGIVFLDTSITATLTIDTFYYDIAV